jgi:hypothetical protein
MSGDGLQDVFRGMWSFLIVLTCSCVVLALQLPVWISTVMLLVCAVVAGLFPSLLPVWLGFACGSTCSVLAHAFGCFLASVVNGSLAALLFAGFQFAPFAQKLFRAPERETRVTARGKRGVCYKIVSAVFGDALYSLLVTCIESSISFVLVISFGAAAVGFSWLVCSSSFRHEAASSLVALFSAPLSVVVLLVVRFLRK